MKERVFLSRSSIVPLFSDMSEQRISTQRVTASQRASSLLRSTSQRVHRPIGEVVVAAFGMHHILNTEVIPANATPVITTPIIGCKTKTQPTRLDTEAVRSV